MLTVATDLETSQVPRRTDVVVTLELATSVLLTSATVDQISLITNMMTCSYVSRFLKTCLFVILGLG